MFKNVSKFLVCTLLAVSLSLCSFVMAAPGQDKKLPAEQRYELVEAVVAEANDRIDNIVASCIATPWDDAEQCVKDTNKIADEAIKYGKQLGVIVVCEYEVIVIDGHNVLIDPIKVIRF